MASTTLQDDYDTAKSSIRDAANRTKATISTLANDTGEAIVEAKDDLRTMARHAGKNVRSFISTRKDDLSHAAESYSDVVRAKPVQSSLLALAAGFVLASLIRR